jgi:hypothetical protein
LVGATIEAHVRTFGRAPHLLAADRGFWSAANKRGQGEGVEKVCIPALGKLKAEQAAEQRQRWFRRAEKVATPWREPCSMANVASCGSATAKARKISSAHSDS